jgi:glyoxylase-like metal-dependent hydrolase (beta-lactamase superfamily II)
MKESMEITPGVHHIPISFVNTYLLVDPDGLTLIDAGMPGNDRRILKYVAGLGRSPRDLKRLLITHSDGDHAGSVAALKAATGARVYASEIEARAMAGGAASRPLVPQNILERLVFALTASMFRFPPAQVDEFLADGQVLPVLGGLRVIETFGHTPGHVSFWLPSAGALFVGDSMVAWRGRLATSSGANTWDAAKAQAAAHTQAALGAKIVCSGHGPVIRDAAARFPMSKS